MKVGRERKRQRCQIIHSVHIGLVSRYLGDSYCHAAASISHPSGPSQPHRPDV